MEFYLIRHKPTNTYYHGGCQSFWMKFGKKEKALTKKQVENFFEGSKSGLCPIWTEDVDKDYIVSQKDSYGFYYNSYYKLSDCEVVELVFERVPATDKFYKES